MSRDERYATRYLSTWPPPFKDTDRSIPTATVRLACGHSNTYDDPAPAAGQSVYCRHCAAYTRVTEETNDA
jgi:hypothetical protein